MARVMAQTWSSTRYKRRKKRFYKSKGFWVGLFAFFIVVGLLGWLQLTRVLQPYHERAQRYDLGSINELEVPSLILDRNGKEIGRIFVENRSVIEYDDIPLTFINALKAGEDSRFDQHHGVDYIGIGRAVLEVFKRGGKIKQGASTITQQLARDAYGLKTEARERGETGFDRKLVEIFLAQRIEKRYNKQQIMTFFVNRSFLGSGFYGLRSASLGYFGKEPRDLTAAEAASIVTILRNPTQHSPLNNIEKNREGRNHVLWRMSEEGMLSVAEYQRMAAEPVVLQPRPLQRGTSHVYEQIANESRQAIGEDAFARGGLVIRTTIIKEAQDAAQEALKQSLARAEQHPRYQQPKYQAERAADFRKTGTTPTYLQGAVLLTDHENGDVLAYVGGRDYAQSQYDFIDKGRKPLGTGFFPFLLAAGLSRDATPATQVEDEPMDNRLVMVGGREGILGEWGAEVERPVYERGMIPLRRAFEQSKVAAMVRLGNQVGLNAVAETARAMGFDVPVADVLPRLLVGWDAVSMRQAVAAVACFGRAGMGGAKTLRLVTRIEDADGRVRWYPPDLKVGHDRMVDEATAYQVHRLMRGVADNGNLRGALKLKPVFRGAVKTGTVHDFSSCWALGYSARVSCGVWCGFLQGNSPAIYEGAFGREIALPVWQAVMNALPDDWLGGEIRKPSSIAEVEVCRVSGQRAGQYCYEMKDDPQTRMPKLYDARQLEFFRVGTEKLPLCGKHSSGDVALTPTSKPQVVVPAVNAEAVRAKQPVLLGADPYQTEMAMTQSDESIKLEAEGAFYRSQDRLGNELDLGDAAARLNVVRPRRLEIELEAE